MSGTTKQQPIRTLIRDRPTIGVAYTSRITPVPSVTIPTEKCLAGESAP